MLSNQNKNYINHLITNNLYQLYEFIGTQNGCTLNKGKNADWVITKPSCWPNMIYNTRTSIAGTYNEIKDIIGYIRKKEAPPFWIITPESDRSLESILENFGMIAIDMLKGMAIDLKEFREKHNGKNINDDLTIAEVSSEGQMLQWTEIVNRIIFKGKKLNQELFTRFVGNPSIHFFTGYTGDVPVTTSMSFISPPSAGFYNIATLPEFRKKGFGTAMTAYAMIEAVNKGWTTGILHASMMGEPVYYKMGYAPYGEYKVFWMAGKEYRDY